MQVSSRLNWTFRVQPCNGWSLNSNGVAMLFGLFAIMTGGDTRLLVTHSMLKIERYNEV